MKHTFLFVGCRRSGAKRYKGGKNRSRSVEFRDRTPLDHEAEWDEVIRTNLTGCFTMIRAAAPLMIKSGGGHILNISSQAGLKGRTGQAAYSASKAGLVGLTISAAHELAEQNIRVNAVVPGYMSTGMGAAAITAMKQAVEESVMKALSEPSEVARCITVLAGMEYITGQVLSLDSRLL